MSAICGRVTWTGPTPDVKAIASSLAPFPADDEGTYSDDFVGLYQRSFWIAPESPRDTLPRAATIGGKRLVLAADCWLLYREDLVSRLGLPRSATHYTDSDLLLQAFSTWGASCVDYIEGYFAFCVWDIESRYLFCARDVMGLRPFFYRADSNGLTFCSELNGLIAELQTDPPLNPQYLAAELGLAELGVSETAFTGIQRLPPGHVLEATPSGERLTRYWRPEEFPFRPVSPDNPRRLADLLRRAVEERSRTNYAIGGTQSGGLDSGAVLCLAAPHLRDLGKQYRVVTGAYPERYGGRLCDESSAVAGLVRRFENVVSTYVQAPGPEAIRVAEVLPEFRFLRASRLRSRSLHGSLLEELAHVDVRVCLTGTGGDNLVSRRHTDSLRRRLSRLKRCLRSPQPSRPSYVRPPWVASVRKASHNSGFGGGIQLLGKPLAQFREDCIGRLPFAYRYPRLDEMILRERPLQLGYPLLDRRVIEFALTLTPSEYTAEGVDRSVMRRATQGLLPDACRLNRTAVAFVPTCHVSTETTCAELRQLLSRLTPESATWIYFDRNALLSEIESPSRSRMAVNAAGLALYVDFASGSASRKS